MKTLTTDRREALKLYRASVVGVVGSENNKYYILIKRNKLFNEINKRFYLYQFVIHQLRRLCSSVLVAKPVHDFSFRLKWFF